MMRTLAVPSDDATLMLSETSDGYFTEIVCRSGDAVRWRALPPGGAGDVWVGVQVDSGAVTAHSWSGWRLEFDPQSGNERSRSFTK